MQTGSTPSVRGLKNLMALYTRLDPGFCVSLDRWLTACSDSSVKLFKQISSKKSMCCNEKHVHMLISQTKHVLYPEQRVGVRSCRMCGAGFYCTCSRCAAAVILADHIWKHCKSTWRISCRTLWPCVVELSQHQAALWKLALPLCNLHV